MCSECDPGSRSSLALLREMWTSILPVLHSEEVSSSKYGSWLNATTRHVDIVLSRTTTSTVCQSQRNFLIREVLKAVSHSKQPKRPATSKVSKTSLS